MPLPAAWYAPSMSGGRIIPIDSSQPEGEAAADTRDNQAEPLELTDPIGDLPAIEAGESEWFEVCLLYTSPSPRDQRGSRMPSSA